jgi:hypothetical protein
MASKQPITNSGAYESLKCTSSRPVNRAQTGDKTYDISVLGPERDAFLADFIALLEGSEGKSGEAAFMAKWIHMEINETDMEINETGSQGGPST